MRVRRRRREEEGNEESEESEETRKRRVRVSTRVEKPRCFSFTFYPGDKSRRTP